MIFFGKVKIAVYVVQKFYLGKMELPQHYTQRIFLDLGLAALMYLLIVVWQGKQQ